MLYARELPDLTEAVIARLNADALPPGLESGEEEEEQGRPERSRPRDRD